MRTFVDANLLIYLNAVREPELKKRYEGFYERLVMDDRVFTDALVLDEVSPVHLKEKVQPPIRDNRQIQSPLFWRTRRCCPWARRNTSKLRR